MRGKAMSERSLLRRYLPHQLAALGRRPPLRKRARGPRAHPMGSGARRSRASPLVCRQKKGRSGKDAKANGARTSATPAACATPPRAWPWWRRSLPPWRIETAFIVRDPIGASAGAFPFHGRARPARGPSCSLPTRRGACRQHRQAAGVATDLYRPTSAMTSTPDISPDCAH